MRSRGIKWILRFQNTRSTRRWRKTVDRPKILQKNCPNWASWFVV
jgi:hypothetical protein